MGLDFPEDGLRSACSPDTNTTNTTNLRKPRWKTRAAYENHKDKRLKPVHLTVADVRCPVCPAGRGEPCVDENGVVRDRPHKRRRRQAASMSRALTQRDRRIRAAQQQRWATVDVRFECPVCGGDHSRAEHHRATAPPTDMIGKALENDG